MWSSVQEAAVARARTAPLLARRLHEHVIKHGSLEEAVAFTLGRKLADDWMDSGELATVVLDGLRSDELIRRGMWADLTAVQERDPACHDLLTPLFDFRGFLVLQAHRAAHHLWNAGGNQAYALFIQSRCAEVYGADIHPGAIIGSGVVSDHTVGLVIGETAIVGNNVTFLHGVTLGGRNDVGPNRHPILEDDVFVGAHAQLLGRIRVGKGAKIGAGAVVLTDVKAGQTIVGTAATVKVKREPTGDQKPA